MKDSTQLQVTKPLKWYNKQVKTDFKKLFLALTKAVVMKLKGDSYSAAKEAIGGADAFELKEEPGGLAYLLILTSMINAAHELAVENQLRFRTELAELEKLYDDDAYVKFLDELNSVLEKDDLTITYNSLANPRSIDILPPFCEHFSTWIQYFGLTAPEAENLANRLPAYFVMAFNQEWSKNAATYQGISDTLFTPATQAATEELEWKLYSDFLIKEVEAPVFDEPFSLRQIHVPLRAYYEKKVLEDGEEKEVKVAVKLVDVLNAWLSTNKAKEAVKVISGGPGSGKSTFAKIWAAQLAETAAIRVLFIPLHFFDLTGDLVEAVGKFIERNTDIHLSYNPLKRKEKVLLIFDGLDELGKQGEYAATIAQQFVKAIHQQNAYCNRDGKIEVLFLLTGRELVVQSNKSDFRLDEQIIHLLPYFLNEDEQQKYEDEQQILAADQRDAWWTNYGNFLGKPMQAIPDQLKIASLADITAQPLLNYLVALSWERDKIDFSQATNLNDIYNDLIEGVHQRAYEGRSYRAIEKFELRDFRRVLEEIAIAAWHGGDTRTTTVNKIQKHINRSGLQPLLDRFQQDAASGITRLLTAFYFREYGIEQGERTFEFTHKSFGEYLTAARLVRQIATIHRQVQLNKANYDEGYGKPEALKIWLHISGESPVDEYLLTFIRNEIKRKPVEFAAELQQLLCDLIGTFFRVGFPIYDAAESIQANLRRSRNAGEALLVLLNACALRTEKVSVINFPSRITFGVWMSELAPVRSLHNRPICLQCLSLLRLSEQELFSQDFYLAHLSGAHLRETDLRRANLILAHLSGADLSEAYLIGANLIGADLREADLSEANLSEADLSEANLGGADLRGVDLSEADLRGADLSEADLSEADLREADLREAYLIGADLREAYLIGADLREADLSEADLRGANLRGANLIRADLSGADLREAKHYTFQQLSRAKSLYGIKGLAPALEKQLSAEKPDLFKE